VAAVALPARGRPPEAAARRAGLEFVEKLLPAMIRVVFSVAGLTDASLAWCLEFDLSASCWGTEKAPTGRAE
jgi:hypothetical protein